jgi:hypothetical protein
VKKGGVLVIADDDKDPYNHAREWWNDDGKKQMIPRQHLFATLGVRDADFGNELARVISVGKGAVIWMRENPVRFALSAEAEARLITAMKRAVSKAQLTWRESNYLALRRGPYLIGAGLNESPDTKTNLLKGRFVNLFDPELKVQRAVALNPGSRVLLLDLDRREKSEQPRLLASACKALLRENASNTVSWTVEGVGDTPAILLISSSKPPRSVHLEQETLNTCTFDSTEGLLYVRFSNEARPRKLTLEF